MMVMCRLPDGREIVAISTDSAERAAKVAHIIHHNGNYADIFVQIGSTRFDYSDFIKQLEKTS